MLFQIFIISTILLVTLLALLVMTLYGDNFSKYLYSHQNYQKIIFVIIYSIEQILFIVSSFLVKKTDEINTLIVSLFALIVLTTVTAQGVILEAINNNNSKQFAEQSKKFSEQRFNIRQNYEKQIFQLKEYISEQRNHINYLELKK